MATNVNVIMSNINDITNEKFLDLWNAEKNKKQKRVSMTEEAFNFVSQLAFDDFGMEQSAFSKEVTKLVLIAKECIENKKLE